MMFLKLIGLLTLFLLVSSVCGIAQVLADEMNPGIYSPDSSPFGTSFIDWTNKWWQWFVGIPNSNNPFEDTTGEKCNVNQVGPVWYLLGSAGRVERHCAIPSDKAILFPILTTECSYSESPTLKNEEELRACAVEENQNAVLTLELDNREINNLDNYKVTSRLFNISYPNDPVYPTDYYTSQAVHDGWYIMIEPLQQGSHEIKFTASQLEGQTGGQDTVLDVTYILNITSPSKLR